jgi:hypothetical protein
LNLDQRTITLVNDTQDLIITSARISITEAAGKTIYATAHGTWIEPEKYSVENLKFEDPTVTNASIGDKWSWSFETVMAVKMGD